MKIKLASEFYYRVEDGDNIKSLCKKFNTNESDILRNNKDLDLYQGEIIKIYPNDYQSHFVKPTETIEVIAKEYNISKEKLIRDNDLKSTRLFIGQRLKIYLDK